MSTPRSVGFTLIELIVTVAVVAILLVVGVPSFTNLMIKSQLSGQIQEFYGAISFARSEAIKRGNYVSICKSTNSSSCSSDNSFNWSGGWIVFADLNNNGTRDNIGNANEEPLLRIFPNLPTNYTLYANDNFKYRVTYDRFGMANNMGTFVFCASSDESKARAIIVTRTRPRIATDDDDDGIPNKDNGTEITSCEDP